MSNLPRPAHQMLRESRLLTPLTHILQGRRSHQGPDDSFSLVECELKALVDDSRVAFDALGEVDYSLKGSEKGNIQFRRSIYFVSDLREGDIITEDDIRSVRPDTSYVVLGNYVSLAKI